MQLYGFFAKDDLMMFKLLLGVSGIGPKGAIGVLGGLTADELRFAVLSDDVRTISKAPGIGKKTAQKLILELKDKLNLEDAFSLKLEHEQSKTVGSSDAAPDPQVKKAQDEAVEALAALGYSPTEALKAVRKVPDDVKAGGDVELVLRAALKNL